MKYDHTAINLQPVTRIKIDKRVAYHQAGHVAAICLGNKQKQLPAVHFQIIIKHQESESQQSDQFMLTNVKNTVKIEGGRLIQSLPLSFSEVTHSFSWDQQEEYRCAFEADVINLLAGPLSEAKYVALRDGEVFNANLVNLRALLFYGGNGDMEVITKYMDCFVPDKVDRSRKLAELFSAAYSFVNKRSHWPAISTLAEFILDAQKNIILCEEVISILEPGLAV